MLYINLKRVMHLRGLENSYKLLLDLGFSPATARKFQGSSVRRINFEHLERLCIALNCTPNDLLEWRPNEKQANPEQQALIKLKREGEEDFSKLLSQIPMDKFEEIINVLQDLKGR